MIALALMLAAQAAQLPPCKGGGASCDPWERAWPSATERDQGPFVLLVRWGDSSPVAIGTRRWQDARLRPRN
jgi:hypothetical protein